MNYPSLSLSADSIERAFSNRSRTVKNKPLTKTIAQSVKKDNIPEPMDGQIKVCDNCDYKTSTYGDLFDHIKQNHVRQGLRHKCPICTFSNKIPARVKTHLYEVHLKIFSVTKVWIISKKTQLN